MRAWMKDRKVSVYFYLISQFNSYAGGVTPFWADRHLPNQNFAKKRKEKKETEREKKKDTGSVLRCHQSPTPTPTPTLLVELIFAPPINLVMWCLWYVELTCFFRKFFFLFSVGWVPVCNGIRYYWIKQIPMLLTSHQWKYYVKIFSRLNQMLFSVCMARVMH